MKIHLLSHDQTAFFAAKELSRILHAIGETSTDIQDFSVYSEDTPALWLGTLDQFTQIQPKKAEFDPIDDEIYIETNGKNGIIAGLNPRSLLIAVYRYATELGCRFLNVGRDVYKRQTWFHISGITPALSQSAADLSLSLIQIQMCIRDRLSKVKDVNSFSNAIGLSMSEIPKPSQSAPDELVSLYTQEQEYVNDFNTFMYKNSITYNGKQYSLSQAEGSSDIELYKLALDYYVVHEQEYGTIFDNLVKIRTKIANYFGYSTYTEVGYMLSGKYYYTPKDTEAIHADVKKYIAPLYYKDVYKRQHR